MLLFLFVLTKNDLNVKTDKLEVKKNEEKNEIRCIQSYREQKQKPKKKKKKPFSSIIEEYMVGLCLESKE